MSRTKAQFSRLLELDRQIREKRYPNATSFAINWEISSKTIQRDIEYIRDQLGAPLVYDYKRRGYYYTHENWQLPALSMTEGELLALLVSNQAAELFKGLPLANDLKGISDKLISVLPDKVTVQHEQLCDKVTFAQNMVRPVDPEIWTVMMQGVLSHSVVRCRYKDVVSQKRRREELSPVHMANIKGDWFVFAYIDGDDHIIQLAVNRLSSAELTEKAISRECPENLKKRIEDSFGRCVYCNGEKLYHFELEFVPELKHIISEKQWGKNQLIRKQTDGSILLSFEDASLMEVFWWVLEWGHGVKVLAPMELQELHIREIEKMTHLYPVDTVRNSLDEDLIGQHRDYVERRI